MIPTIIAQRTALTDTAVGELRKAGYFVVRVDDISKVQEFTPKGFEGASIRAKIKTLDYHMGGGGSYSLTQNDLNSTYIQFLKQEGGF